MASSLFASILAFILLLGPSAIVAGQDQSTCNRNGGNLVVFENRACADLNYTFTEWCNVVDGSDGCQVTAKSCGCKYGVFACENRVYMYVSLATFQLF